MERILLLVNPNAPNEPSITFACHIARLTNAVLAGGFVGEMFDKTTISANYIPFAPAGIPAIQPLPRTSSVSVEAFVGEFSTLCRKMDVPFEVVKETFLADIINQSVFFDLLIVDPKYNFAGAAEEVPTGPAKVLLHEAQCPVLVAPEIFTAIGGVIFCYDGSSSSVQAIRQFTHLFPQLNNRPVTLLEVNPENTAQYRQRHKEMADWLRTHFEIIEFASVKGTVRDELFVYLFRQRGKMVIMGAYGRSLASELFRHSVANPVLRATDLPLFVYHK